MTSASTSEQAVPFAMDRSIPERAGVGFKLEHFDAMASDWDAVADAIGWVEVHAENFMGAGGAPHRRLRAVRERFPISVHGVGLSIGAEAGLDPEHLERFATVVDRYAPGLVSEHLAWSTHDAGQNAVFLNDLLPVPYTEAVADRVADHIAQIQDRLGRRMLLENPSTYVRFTDETLSETEFLRRVTARCGCGFLLDINNVHVSATNHGYDPVAYLTAFPLDAVGEIHLGGHATDEDEVGAPLLIDAHDREVADPVWDLYAWTIERIGPRPTLIEWDNDVPDWPVLAEEARRAEAIMDRARAAEGDAPRRGRDRADAAA